MSNVSFTYFSKRKKGERVVKLRIWEKHCRFDVVIPPPYSLFNFCPIAFASKSVFIKSIHPHVTQRFRFRRLLSSNTVHDALSIEIVIKTTKGSEIQSAINNIADVASKTDSVAQLLIDSCTKAAMEELSKGLFRSLVGSRPVHAANPNPNFGNSSSGTEFNKCCKAFDAGAAVKPYEEPITDHY